MFICSNQIYYQNNESIWFNTFFLKILYSTNRQSYDESDVDYYVDSDYYDYDDHENFGYCYDSDEGSTIYCFF